MKVSESYVGSDKTTLTFVSENETVKTPAGTFEGCKLYEIKHPTAFGMKSYKNYYKEGVGIVKCISSLDGLCEERALSSFTIVGGKGLLPLALGNRWEYIAGYNPEFLDVKIEYSVEYMDTDTVILKSDSDAHTLTHKQIYRLCH